MDLEQHHFTNTTPARRTVLLGAAWTTPVVALAVAAPAAVASTPCPDFGDFASWTVNIQGEVIGSTGGLGFVASMDPSVFESVADNALTGNPTFIFVRSSFTAVAGRTYNFFIDLQSNYGNPGNNSAPNSLDIFMGGTRVFYGTSRPGTYPQLPLTTPPASTQTATYTRFPLTFTATTSGTTEVLYRFTLESRGTRIVSDDIRVSVPVFISPC
ncbi:hypothetical protein [Pseudoclavibacter helvolus]|uniref:hypothetical protein n=1 Tax=Pseudoclavibacter helvolus TaxID=255205 RepID=UPI003C75FAC8